MVKSLNPLTLTQLRTGLEPYKGKFVKPLWNALLGRMWLKRKIIFIPSSSV